MTKEVRKALQEVRKYHPTVTHVSFNIQGQWCYYDNDFNSPEFSDGIDQSILEDASDSVATLPCVFCIREEEEVSDNTIEDLGLTDLEVVQIVKEWYTKRTEDIFQDEDGTDLEEYCEKIQDCIYYMNLKT